MLRDRRRK
jgi:ubiquitin-conjugating enzyme E2 H